MSYQHFSGISNDVIKNSSSSYTINTKPFEAGAIMNNMCNYAFNHKLKALDAHNTDPSNGFTGNIQGTSSHIYNFTSNIYNVPPPPIPQPTILQTSSDKQKNDNKMASKVMQHNKIIQGVKCIDCI